MSVRSEISTDIYRQMMELQERLRQSEAERIRLEEMFTVLVKTFREEEDMRLKNLENRYQTFLEDCARRSYRNEKILRSVERVESGANALHAKTERLKLLRSHYEAYLERVIPTWRQPALLRYGPSPLPSTQDVEWSIRNHLIPVENVDANNPNYLPFGPIRPARTYTSNPIMTSEYFSNRLSDGETHMKSFQSDRTRPDTNYWNRMSREPEGKRKVIYGYDKSFQGDVGFHHVEHTTDTQPRVLRSRFENEYVDDGTTAITGLESALNRKLAIGSIPELPKDLLYHENIYKDNPEAVFSRAWDGAGKSDQPVNKQAQSPISPVHREQHWFLDRRKEALPRDVRDFDKSYDRNDTPQMTREPVEIKKPEIIVGKVHPEASLKVDYLKNGSNFEGPYMENVKSDNLLKPFNDGNLSKNGRKVEPEIVKPEPQPRQTSPQAKWGLLKHRRTIDKLKETLSFEEAQKQKLEEENKQIENGQKLSIGRKSPEHSRKESDKTDVSQRLSEGWRPSGEQLMSSRLVVQASDKEARQRNDIEYRAGENTNEFVPTYPENFQELPQESINDPKEEIYEDNEESYPESYYEQPPKSDYSRDIVSNVILEEDENEVNMHDELTVQENVQGNSDYQQSQYTLGQEDNIQTDYNAYSVEGTGEVKNNESEYQNFQASDQGQGYNNGEMYQANYNGMQPQEGYTYDNQEVDNYKSNSGLEYNTMEQYPGNAEAQQYYEGQQPEEQANYGGEGMNEGENFDNSYNQVQTYENNPAVEQYNEGNGQYQQEYSQGQEGNYYSQGEYDGYYQNQQQQNEEYTQQENIGYQEQAGYGNVQGDGGTYPDGGDNLPLRQSNLSHLLESDSESFQMEHGSAAGNEDSDFDFSMSQQQ